MGDLVVDTNACVVTLRGNPVALSPREFDLLQTLALDAGRVVRAAQPYGILLTGPMRVLQPTPIAAGAVAGGRGVFDQLNQGHPAGF